MTVKAFSVFGNVCKTCLIFSVLADTIHILDFMFANNTLKIFNSKMFAIMEKQFKGFGGM